MIIKFEDTMRQMTDRARRVIELAREAARNRGHLAIKPEHILIGLLEEGEGVGAYVLRYLGADLDSVRNEVRSRMPPDPTALFGGIDFDDVTLRLCRGAADELAPMRHNYVGTEHLALALAHVSDGVCPEVLRDIGISPARLRREIFMLLGHFGLANPKSS